MACSCRLWATSRSPRAVEIAVRAEKAGWDGLFVSDLVRFPEGSTESDACITLAAIAATTSRMTLGLVTPVADRRRPWVLARQSAMLDHLSGGRLVFQTGIGYASWHEELAPPAQSKSGEEEDARLSLFEESLAVLQLCWSGEPVRHEGRWMHVDSPPFLPTPLQRPRIPVWVSASWPRRSSLRRAAHLDGICPIFTSAWDPRASERRRCSPDPLRAPAARGSSRSRARSERRARTAVDRGVDRPDARWRGPEPLGGSRRSHRTSRRHLSASAWRPGRPRDSEGQSSGQHVPGQR